MNIVYKCVDRDSTPNDFRGVGSIGGAYVIGKKTMPSLANSWLYAFKDLKSANLIASKYSHRIIKCEAGIVMDPGLVIGVNSAGRVELFWNGMHCDEVEDGTPDMRSYSAFVYADEYPGTVWCDWLKPLEEI